MFRVYSPATNKWLRDRWSPVAVLEHAGCWNTASGARGMLTKHRKNTQVANHQITDWEIQRGETTWTCLDRIPA